MHFSLVIFCVLGLALNAQSASVFPDKFVGKWQLGESENFDEYLQAKGYGWLMRKIVTMASITKIFTKNADGTANCEILTTKKNVKWSNFQMDTEFQAEYLDDSQHKIKFSFENGKLIEWHQKVDSDEKPDVYEYTINEKGQMVMRMEYNNVSTLRYYDKV